ncbi:MAG: type II toxin-antitoxin system RelE/ParE family toxin [Acidobacteriota bacterium]
MIRSFRHKGVEKFFTGGNKKGIQPEQARRLRQILFRLHSAENVFDMDFPGSRLHRLKGKLKNYWAASVSGNWRFIFRFERGHAWEVDYDDYH